MIKTAAKRHRRLAAIKRKRGPIRQQPCYVALNDAMTRVALSGLVMTWAAGAAYLGYLLVGTALFSILCFAASLVLAGLSIAQITGSLSLFLVVFDEWDPAKSSRSRDFGIALMTTIVILGCLWTFVAFAGLVVQDLGGLGRG